MKVNVGSADRAVRIAAGLILIGLALSGSVGAWGYIGVIPLMTGLFRFCPAYSVIGANTCGLPKQ